MPKRRDKAEPPGSGTAGTIVLLIAAGVAAFPQLRNWPLVASAAVLGLSFHLVGSGRVYRPAVTREDEVITCRFNPCREAAFYFVLIGIPSLGLMTISAGSTMRLGSPEVWRIVGIIVIAGAPITLFKFVGQSRQSLLRISPTSLTVRRPGQRTPPIEIRRGAVEEIAATTARMRNNDSAPATEITYLAQDATPGKTDNVRFGPANTKETAWLTVEQADLLAGLQAWKDGDPNEPGLMDRVEAILRGQTPSTPDDCGKNL